MRFSCRVRTSPSGADVTGAGLRLARARVRWSSGSPVITFAGTGASGSEARMRGISDHAASGAMLVIAVHCTAPYAVCAVQCMRACVRACGAGKPAVGVRRLLLTCCFSGGSGGPSAIPYPSRPGWAVCPQCGGWGTSFGGFPRLWCRAPEGWAGLALVLWRAAVVWAGPTLLMAHSLPRAPPVGRNTTCAKLVPPPRPPVPVRWVIVSLAGTPPRPGPGSGYNSRHACPMQARPRPTRLPGRARSLPAAHMNRSAVGRDYQPNRSAGRLFPFQDGRTNPAPTCPRPTTAIATATTAIATATTATATATAEGIRPSAGLSAAPVPRPVWTGQHPAARPDTATEARPPIRPAERCPSPEPRMDRSAPGREARHRHRSPADPPGRAPINIAEAATNQSAPGSDSR